MLAYSFEKKKEKSQRSDRGRERYGYGRDSFASRRDKNKYIKLIISVKIILLYSDTV